MLDIFPWIPTGMNFRPRIPTGMGPESNFRLRIPTGMVPESKTPDSEGNGPESNFGFRISTGMVAGFALGRRKIAFVLYLEISGKTTEAHSETRNSQQNVCWL